MKGKIWAEDNPNGGAIFYFDIPYRPVQAKNAQFTEINLSAKPLHKKSILVVEDDPVSMAYMSEILERTGANVFEAETGRAALSIIDHETIDLVLMDIQLPGISGYETANLIKEKHPGIPIIAQTAHAFAEQKKKCMDAGCNNYLAKPFTDKALLEMIHTTLNFKGL
jgi:CheY-like chemotaxis protein